MNSEEDEFNRIEREASLRCPLCNYQHGHAIGCKNNPVDIALNKMAENARELGLDYEPLTGTQISKVWWDGDKLMAKPIPLESIYKEPEQPARQEPVAEYIGECSDGSLVQLYDDVKKGTKFYTSPPAQRTWVGLADGDKAEIKKQANYNWETTAGEYASKVQALTEAKLKEKNT